MNSKSRFNRQSNIVLVGMPGAGKSTVGVVLAKQTARSFVDTDVLIQTTERRTLQDIVDREGHIVLRGIEERVILSLACRKHVIATGGSAAYSAAAMEHLRANGVVVFLDVPLARVCERIADFNKRGIARRKDQTLEDLFEERYPLYLRHSDLRIECGDLAQDPLAELICERLDSMFPGLLPGGPAEGRPGG